MSETFSVQDFIDVQTAITTADQLDKNELVFLVGLYKNQQIAMQKYIRTLLLGDMISYESARRDANRDIQEMSNTDVLEEWGIDCSETRFE